MKQIEPIKSGIKAVQHEPEYTVHRYFARRPHNVINYLITHYAPDKPSLVFDPFGGGGTMLYESLICGHRAIACDTSDLAAFIIEQEALMPSANLDILSEFVDELMSELSDTFSFLYSFQKKEVYWIQWSSYTSCPSCGRNVYLSPYNTMGTGKYTCTDCGEIFRPQRVHADNITPTEISLLEKGSIRKGRANIQERIKLPSKVILAYYNNLCEELEKLGLGESMIPCTPIPDCNLQRESALHKKGILHFEQFIPKATRAIITFIGNYIVNSNLSNEEKRCMLFVLSASLRYCSRFSTLNKSWRGDKPMEWAKSNFWTPYTFVEVNPIITFYERWESYIIASRNAKKKYQKFPEMGTCSEVVNGSKTFSVINASSDSVPDLPDCSVDLVITDPPYGSYLHYGELSAFWTTWLNKFLPEISSVPDRTKEAVPARKTGYPGWKDFSEYEDILSKVFSETYRVLKENHYCVVTFNNKEPEAWIAFLRAVKRAGFILPPGGIIFQDGVEAYKKSIDSRRGGAIFGDFVYSFIKSKSYDTSEEPLDATWLVYLERTLEMIANENDTISNVSLYTKIYFDLLPVLFRAIDIREKDCAFIKDMSFKNFELKIQHFFDYSDGIWTKKKK